MQLNLKPTHAPIQHYYQSLARFGHARFDNEGNIREAFGDLLKKCARQFDWTLIPVYPIAGSKKTTLRVDGALISAFNLPPRLVGSKRHQRLSPRRSRKEIRPRLPTHQHPPPDPHHALLVQDGCIQFDGEISDPIKLVDVLRPFFEYIQPQQENWDRAVREFAERIPEIA